MNRSKIAVVTGASAGFGLATAELLAGHGFQVIVGARRRERIEALAGRIGGRAVALDVTDEASVASFAAAVPEVDVLVNNAGLALGMDRVESADTSHWQRMYDTNVLGVMRLTRALLPRLSASGDAHVVNIGSISGFEVYPGGAGYTASKHAARALTKTLRLELLGQPIRITEICPGLAETEFSEVRFGGDAARARAVYQGMEPLRAADVAECVLWAVTRPSHVNIDEIVVRPRDQATSTRVHRR